MGCVFPDALNIDDFWKNILGKKYSITEVPHDRWDVNIYYNPDKKMPDKTYSKIGGFVRHFEFNSVKYKISPKSAKSMDVVQKWSLVAAGQALKDAGIKTDGKDRLNIAVIVGNCLSGNLLKLTDRRVFIQEIVEKIKSASSDYDLSEKERIELIEKVKEYYIADSPEITEDTLPGELPNVIAGRIASVFNLTGKSMAVDAACATGLAAVDTAVKGLMVNDYDTVLVGAAEGVMDPASYVKFSKISALSERGSSPFDAKADGFVMGEGCGFIVLKRLEDAVRDGNKIYAVISGIGSSSDGKGKGITAPNPRGQKQAIEMAHEKAGVSPHEIQYIEAHGTSTKVGDVTEIEVLQEIFRDRKNKFAVSSIKSQIGHLKAAAGMAGIIKTALSIYNKILPPSANFEEPNPKIDWEKSPFFINTEAIEWKKSDNIPKKAGVSAFGFGGVNYHVIVEEYDPHNISYERSDNYIKVSEEENEKKLCFIFSGQGSQYVGMGKELYEKYPVVKNTVEEAEKICLTLGNFSIKEKLFGLNSISKEENEKNLKDTKYTQPALYTIEMALYRLLKEKGIVPHFVAGHSSGEYSALAASGVFSFEDGLRAIIARASAMSETQKISKGTMAAIEASSSEVEEVISSIKEYVTVANYNSPKQTVISGTVEGVEKSVARFKEKSMGALKLNVSTAFHSELMDDAVMKMNNVLDKLTFNKPQISIYANVTGDKYPENPDEIRNILKQQIRSSVRWDDIIKNVYEDGGKVFVEIGPKKALFNFIGVILKGKKDFTSFYTLNSKEKEEETFEKVCKEIEKNSFKKSENKQSEINSFFNVLEADGGIKDLLTRPFFDEYLKENKDLIRTFFSQGYKLFSERYKPSDKDTISITGAGAGLPGKNRHFFHDSNINAILNGECLIDPVDENIQKEILNKNILRLVKSPEGISHFEPIDDISRVIQLAGQAGEFNPEKDFSIDKKLLKSLDITFQMAICSGYEALRDAGIPLVQSYKNTSCGRKLKSSFVLPEELQEDTGVIFASAFPGYEELIKEVSNYLTSEDYSFSRDFLIKILSMGHSHFARLIQAKGPSTYINAACACATQAIGIAEDWIKRGRCNRVILISADNPTGPVMLPWIGSGFLASGAASVKSNIEEAVLPFGEKRHGIVLGTSAAGLVIENESSAKTRGVKPLVDIMGTHFTNSAFHETRLDTGNIAAELERFISKIEKSYNISRDEIAGDCLYMSHESYTPARGGSGETEIKALRKVFGHSAGKIIITNIKGYTGHTLGSGIEDAMTVKIMEAGRIPGIYNYEKISSDFKDCLFAEGNNKRVKYALRFAAGFGSQLCYTMFRLNTYENRFDSPEYLKWLEKSGGTELYFDGRLLKLKRADEEYLKQEIIPAASDQVMDKLKEIISITTGYPIEELHEGFRLEEDLGVDSLKQAEIFGEARRAFNLSFDESVNISDYPALSDIAGYIESKIITEEVIEPKEVSVKISSNEIMEKLKEIISEITGYSVVDLEDDFKLEEDLGIDSLKQAEIFGEARRAFNLPFDETVNIADYPGLSDIAGYIKSKIITEEVTEPEERSVNFSSDKIMLKLKEIICEITGYSVTDLEDDFKLEEDLGIDSLKQAEIFGEARRAFNLPFDETVNIADYPALSDIAWYIKSKIITEEKPEESITREIFIDEANLPEDPSLYSSTMINKIMPLFSPLKERTSDRIDIKDEKLLLFHSASVLSDEIIKELGKRNITHSSYYIKDEKRLTEDYSLVLIILPDNKNSVTEDMGYFKALFNLFKKLDLKETLKIIVLSPEMFFGFEEGANPLSGGLTGFIKTIGKEYNIPVKHIYSSDKEEIFKEIEYFHNGREVSYKDGKRFILASSDEINPADIHKELNCTSGDLVIVTGGARGITFECIKDLFTGMGKPALAIMGRTVLQEENEGYSRVFSKEKIKEGLKKRYDRVTPMMVEQEWKKGINRAETAKNISYLKKKGLTVKYFSLDVSCKEDVERAIKKAQEEFKLPVSMIIHGAGIEESKLFKNKKLEKAEEILSVKIKGLMNILNTLAPGSLKRVICFSSITGRSGNEGQIDYSFANGYISRLCWMINQKYNYKALSIDWTAWEGTGMAAESLEILKSRGVSPISSQAGKNIMKKLFYSSFSEEVIVTGEDDYEEDKQPEDKFPMIDSFKEEDNLYIASRTLSLERDNHIKDHIYKEVPLLPGVMGIEAAAEVYYRAENKTAQEFYNIEFKYPVKMLNIDQKEMKVLYNPGNNSVNVNSIFTSKALKGREVEHENFSMEVSHLSTKTKTPDYRLPAFNIPFMTGDEVYDFFGGNRFVFKESFRVIDRLVYIDSNTIITKINLPDKPLFNDKDYTLQINPLTIEGGFQTVSLFCSIINSTINLPSRVKKIKIVNRRVPAYVYVCFKKYVDKHRYFDILITDEQGELIAIIEDIAMIDSDVVTYRNKSVHVLDDQLNMSEQIASMGDIYLINTEYMEKLLLPDKEEMHGKLKETELARYNEISNVKRKNEYLAGIICAREIFARTAGDFSETKNLEIRKDKNDKPFYYDVSSGKLIDKYLSISHSDKYTLAIISNMPSGIDIQKIEERKEGFYLEAFTEKERELIGRDASLATKIWTVKEAFLKSQGNNGNGKDIEISFDEEGRIIPGLSEKLKKELTFTGDKIEVKSKIVANYAVACCTVEI